MFIAVTKIKAPAEALDRIAEAFRRSASDLMQFPGFVGLELWRSADTLEAISRWESREAMEAYSASSLFQAHHGRPADTSTAQGPGAAGQIEFYEGELIV